MKAFCTLLVALSLAPGVCAFGDWSVFQQTNSPSPRAGHSIVPGPDGTSFMVFGGYDGQEVNNDLYSYSCSDNAWTLVETPLKPPPRRYHASWFSNGKMYVHGGQISSEQTLDDLWSYDAVQKQWAYVPVAGQKPSGRYGHLATVLADGSVILTGGTYGATNLKDTWRFNADNTFTLLSVCPIPMSHHVGQVVGDVLWLFAAGEKIVKFNVTDKTWSTSDGGPPLLGYSSSALGENEQGESIITIFGGMKYDKTESDVVYEYGVNRLVLAERQQRMQFPLLFASSAALVGDGKAAPKGIKVLFFGGVSNGKCIDTTFMFSTMPAAGGCPDFNKDGKTDILWRSGATGDLYAWYMDGAAKLGTGFLGAVADQSWRVAGSGDFDSDGSSDILWRNYSTGENYVWYMDGSTHTGGGPLGAVPDSAWKVAGVADFDADGRPDILWRNSSTGENYLWFMDGLVQKSAAAVEAVADLNWGVAGVGDFNADGKPDILWRNASTGDNYAWYMNAASHEGGAYLEAVADPAWLAAWVGDYDGDGDADILWRNASTGESALWTMDGVTHAGTAPLEAVPDRAWRMWDAPAPVLGVPSDFDLDGKADVLWRSATTGDLYVWTMDGVVSKGAGAAIGAVADAGWKVAGMADFNSDGNTDLLWRNYGTGENFVWYMNGLVQYGREALEAVGDLNWLAVGTGDFNGDGKPDILWRNYSTGANYVWYMDGAAHSGGAPLDAVADPAWKIAGAADFDGDGKTDVLWRNTATGQVYIWTMDGVAHVGGADLGVVPLEWAVSWTADYSGDGNPDILWRNTATGENYVWYIAGAAQIGGAPMDPVGDLAWAIMPQVY